MGIVGMEPQIGMVLMLVEVLRDVMCDYIIAHSILENKKVSKEQLTRLSYDELSVIYHSVQNFSKRI